jgi:hypothetical protein
MGNFIFGLVVGVIATLALVKWEKTKLLFQKVKGWFSKKNKGEV